MSHPDGAEQSSSPPGLVKILVLTTMCRDSRADWPELRLMTSTGLPANNTPGNGEAREPRGDEVCFWPSTNATLVPKARS